MTTNKREQIIKCHDDHNPVRLDIGDTAAGVAAEFKLAEGSSCSWARSDKPFGPEKLRTRIEPWLTALVQSEHLSLLIGSGLTHAVHGMAGAETLPGMNTVTFGSLDEAITADAKRTSMAAGRQDGNFEDQIRAANELLRGLEIIEAVQPEDDADDANEEQAPSLREALQTALDDFAKSILAGERNLVSAPAEARDQAFNYLVSFLMSFASRTGTRERLQLFTTNYDRYIEAGADAAGLRLIDRFVGTLAPVFRASRLDVDLHYNPPGIRGEPRYLEGVARFTKLHGSVDWVESEQAIRRIGLPFGANDPEPFLTAPGLDGADALRLMIYPNAAKDRETSSYPFVELFRDFAAASCRPNSTLICYGYGFGDEHINRVIEDMLTIPSSHLVVISHSDPLGRIMAAYDKLGRHAQVTLLLGDHLGDLKMLVDNYLPKPAIDRTTFRMAELLKARWGTSKTADANDTPPPGDEGSSAS